MSLMPIAVAVYLPERYPRLLATAEDASGLEATWEEWHDMLQETRREMSVLGIDLIEMTIDLDALEKYCHEQGLKNTSSTRAQYAVYLLSELHQRQVQLQRRSPLQLRSKKKKRKTR